MTQILIQICTFALLLGPIWGIMLGWWLRGWVANYRIVRRDKDEPSELGARPAGRART